MDNRATAVNYWINAAALAALLVTVLGSGSHADVSTSKQQQAQALITQALEAELTLGEDWPYQDRWRVKLLGMRSGSAEGEFRTYFKSPRSLRSEITFQYYKDVRVVVNDKYWTLRSHAHMPVRIYQFFDAIFSSSHLDNFRGCAPKKIRQRKVAGDKATCVSYKCGELTGLCFSSSSGVLREVEYSSHTVRYADHAVYSGKLMPQTVQLLDGDLLVVEGHLEELLIDVPPPEDLLKPPSGATPRPWCLDPQPPRLLERPPIDYPERSQMQGVAGTVWVSGWVNASGGFENLKIMGGGSKALEDAVLKSVRKYRFRPAMCGDTPVPVERHVRVDFLFPR